MAKLKHGEILKQLIENRKISVRKLAVEVGIPQPTLSAYVRGRDFRNVHHLIKLAAYFNVSLDYLILGQESVKKADLKKLKGSEIFSGICRIKIEKIFEDDGE